MSASWFLAISLQNCEDEIVQSQLFYYSLLVAGVKHNCKRKCKKTQENRISKSQSLSFFF